MQTQPNEDFEHLHDIISDFTNAMLVTQDGRHVPHARPMVIADLTPEGDLWFVTARGSGKVAEVTADPRVLVTMQGRTRQASVRGTATVVDDAERLEALWNKAWDAWFPEGPEGADAVLIRVRGVEGEYWDASGMDGVRFVFETARALMKDERVDPDRAGSHGRVDL